MEFVLILHSFSILPQLPAAAGPAAMNASYYRKGTGLEKVRPLHAGECCHTDSLFFVYLSGYCACQ